MGFERTCRGCQRRRSSPGTYPCPHCKTVTQTVWRWIEGDNTRVCAVCGRHPAEGMEPLCSRCLRRVAQERARKLREVRQAEQGKL